MSVSFCIFAKPMGYFIQLGSGEFAGLVTGCGLFAFKGLCRKPVFDLDVIVPDDAVCDINWCKYSMAGNWVTMDVLGGFHHYKSFFSGRVELPNNLNESVWMLLMAQQSFAYLARNEVLL